MIAGRRAGAGGGFRTIADAAGPANSHGQPIPAKPGGRPRPAGPDRSRHRRPRRSPHGHQCHRPLPAAARAEEAAHRHLRSHLAVHRRGAEIRRHDGRGPAGRGRDHPDREPSLLHGAAVRMVPAGPRGVLHPPDPPPLFRGKGRRFHRSRRDQLARHGQSVPRRQPGDPGLRPLHQQQHAGNGPPPVLSLPVHHPLPGTAGPQLFLRGPLRPPGVQQPLYGRLDRKAVGAQAPRSDLSARRHAGAAPGK